MDALQYPFLFFLPAVVLVYYLVPQRWRWWVLLASSAAFVAWAGLVDLVAVASAVLVNYAGGRWLIRTDSVRTKRYRLWLLLGANVGVLGAFKYYNAINRGQSYFGIDLVPHVEWLLPLGISYYIFQAIGYQIELYRGTETAERHLGHFATYLAFFPKLTAGPIERSRDFLIQLKTGIPLQYENISIGGRLLLWGFFKKMYVSTLIAEITVGLDHVVHHGARTPMILLWFLYAIEVYVDFSAYTDIALGGARLFGIRLTQNFRQPFLARSLTDFWRRWHISLSCWVNDYVYTPLSMWLSLRFRLGKFGVMFSVVFSFLLLGIWHGTDWNFALFGLLQGAVIAWEITTRNWRRRHFSSGVGLLAGRFAALLVFAFSCLLFRADHWMDMLAWVSPVFQAEEYRSASLMYIWPSLVGIGGFMLADHGLFRHGFENWCTRQHFVLRWVIYFALIYATVALSGAEVKPFIYQAF